MFHKSNYGAFGNVPCDKDGYVPEAEDTAFAFEIDHGAERTHNDDGTLTEYGQWWKEDGFPEWRDRAIEATAEASAALIEWQQQNA